MNQILANPSKIQYQNLKTEISNEIVNKFDNRNLNIKKKNPFSKKKLIKNKYSIQFLISFLIAIVFIVVFLYHLQKLNNQEKISKKLLTNYSLTTLYKDTIDTSKFSQQSVIVENPFVIGMIKISKINLNYPILSQNNSELLKISLCRFAGPMPNEIGNLCIAGHNYVDNKFFSRLKELEKNDLIEIYDLSGKKITYSIFDKYEINPTDLSCTNQDVGNSKIVTLLTCNNFNGKRTIVKAIEQNSNKVP